MRTHASDTRATVVACDRAISEITPEVARLSLDPKELFVLAEIDEHPFPPSSRRSCACRSPR
jgi:hypothetical protein